VSPSHENNLERAFPAFETRFWNVTTHATSIIVTAERDLCEYDSETALQSWQYQTELGLIRSHVS